MATINTIITENKIITLHNLFLFNLVSLVLYFKHKIKGI